jgi:hypothetical protein
MVQLSLQAANWNFDFQEFVSLSLKELLENVEDA